MTFVLSEVVTIHSDIVELSLGEIGKFHYQKEYFNVGTAVGNSKHTVAVT